MSAPIPERLLGAILEAAATRGLVDFRITGGEPLLVPELVAEVAERLARFPSTRTIHLTTNGSCLLESLPWLESLPKLDLLKVSLDTIDENEFYTLTGQHGLRGVLAGIRRASDSRIPVRINAVVSRITLHSLWDLLNWCNQLLLPVKLLDVNGYGDPGLQVWRDLFVPLAAVREALHRQCSSARWTHGVGGFGIPMEEFEWKNITITVKDSTVGTTYSSLCEGCALLWKTGREVYCQEGLYNLTLTTDGKLIMCRQRPDLSIPLHDSFGDIEQLRSLFRTALKPYDTATMLRH